MARQGFSNNEIADYCGKSVGALEMIRAERPHDFKGKGRTALQPPMLDARVREENRRNLSRFDLAAAVARWEATGLVGDVARVLGRSYGGASDIINGHPDLFRPERRAYQPAPPGLAQGATAKGVDSARRRP
jgi:hypothetical protein